MIIHQTMTTTRLALCLSFALFLFYVAQGAQVTITNNCSYIIWPGTQANEGSAQLSKTGFELASKASTSLTLPSPWSGKFWARTGCSNNNGKFSCVTADCDSGVVECNGKGEATPASLVEITAVANGGQDTYDVSNVDGFNIPSSITPQGVNGTCKTASCPANINANCPAQLQMKNGNDVVACKSACVAFGTPEYCCSDGHNTSQTCPPTNYSQFFSQQCPNAYSYAYDDKKGTFNCAGGPNYAITFCPA